MSRVLRVKGLIAILLCALFALSADSAFASAELVSRSSNTAGIWQPAYSPDDDSSSASVSEDGRYVAFESRAESLYTDDSTDGDDERDIFVYDTVDHLILRVTEGVGGAAPSDDSQDPSISDDGRYVVYSSDAENLVSTDSNGYRDVFLFDISTGETTLVNQNGSGISPNGGDSSRTDAPVISGDGSAVAYSSDATTIVSGDSNGATDIFLYNVASNTTETVSDQADGTEGNGDSTEPSLSDDGQLLAYTSEATDLIVGDTNSDSDVYAVDLSNDDPFRVSSNNYSQVNGDSDSPSVSSNGLYIAFTSEADDLGDTPVANGGQRDIFRRYLDSSSTPDEIRMISLNASGGTVSGDSDNPSVSDDGSVAFDSDAGDLAAEDSDDTDVFLYRDSTAALETVSVDTSGLTANDGSENPAITADGKYIAFESDADDIDLFAGDATYINTDTDIFLRNTDTNDTAAITNAAASPSAGAIGGSEASISANGRYVAFRTPDENSEIYVRDRISGTTEKITTGTTGEASNGDSQNPSISADGRYVVFESKASNLDSRDSNGRYDVFRYDRNTDTIRRISITYDGSAANDDSYYPTISADGKKIAFTSTATNLARNDTNSSEDVFVHDSDRHTTTRVSVSYNTVFRNTNDNSGHSSISANGRYVAFESYASNIVPGDYNDEDIFIYDIWSGKTKRIKSGAMLGAGHRGYPSISADGSYVAFTRLDGIEQVYLYTRSTDSIRLISRNTSGQGANDDSAFPSISPTGRFIAYQSSASDIATGDSGGFPDIFLCDLYTHTTLRVNGSAGMGFANDDSGAPTVSADGDVAFESTATNLNPLATTGEQNIFVNDH